jgi:hypothetical protein
MNGVFGELRGPTRSGSEVDFGLPFVLGRPVYVGIEGMESSLVASRCATWLSDIRAPWGRDRPDASSDTQPVRSSARLGEPAVRLLALPGWTATGTFGYCND